MSERAIVSPCVADRDCDGDSANICNLDFPAVYILEAANVFKPRNALGCAEIFALHAHARECSCSALPL